MRLMFADLSWIKRFYLYADMGYCECRGLQKILKSTVLLYMGKKNHQISLYKTLHAKNKL